MAIYAYKCDSCNEEWTEIQSVKDDHIKICPTCKLESARRVFRPSRISISFIEKGEGIPVEKYVGNKMKRTVGDLRRYI